MNRKVAAALLSGLACPGAGQIYNRQYVKGAVLVSVSLLIIAALFYATWGGIVAAVASVPLDKAIDDMFRLARMVLASNEPFYDRATTAFTVVWLYGIADAYYFGGRKGLRG